MDSHTFRGATRRCDSPDNQHRRTATCPIHWPWRRAFLSVCLMLVLGAAVLTQTGCVERRMTIRTNMDNQGGALAYVDGQEVGVTPVSTGFTFYGDRKIRLIKDGYETVTLVQPIRAPWWDSLFLEFITENLWPFTLRDERDYRYDLPPQLNVTGDELLQRAHKLRTEGQLSAEPVVPAGGPAASKVNF